MFKLFLTILLIYFAYKFFFEGRLFLRNPGPKQPKENLREHQRDTSNAGNSKKEDYVDYEEIE